MSYFQQGHPSPKPTSGPRLEATFRFVTHRVRGVNHLLSHARESRLEITALCHDAIMPVKFGAWTSSYATLLGSFHGNGEKSAAGHNAYRTTRYSLV